MDDSRNGIDETSSISDDELSLLKEIRRRNAEPPHRSLLIYHPDGLRVVTLSNGVSVVVGRAAPADVAVRASAGIDIADQ